MTPIPTIASLKADILAALEGEFTDLTLNPFGRAFLVALAVALAGLLYIYYLSVGFTQKNIWFDTADSIENGGTLQRFGLMILGRLPSPAVSGQYTCSVTGTAGAVINANTVFQSDDSAESPGMLFRLNGGAYTLTGSGDTIVVNALTGGLISRLTIGDTLTSTSPIVNVNSTITVTIEGTVPVDKENLEDYRRKIKEKVQLEPGSWNAVDYRLVGIGIIGVLQTYAYADSGESGEVNVFLQGNTPVASPGPSVSPTVLSNYETALELVKPLSVWQVNYASSPINNIAVTITMGTFPAFSAAQQADILTALTDFINSVHPFIASADNIAERNDVIAIYNLSAIVTAAVPGSGFSSLSFTVAGSPEVYWQADNGEIAFLTGIVYA